MNEVYDPNRRQHYTFFPDGENMIVEIRVAPGGDGPPHLHLSQEERWSVRNGRVRLKVDGRKVVPEPGEEIVVPAGVKHSFKNIGRKEARLRAKVLPAGDIEAFLTEGAELARAGCYTRRGVVTSLAGARRMADFLERYSESTVILWPPPFVQRVLTALVRRSQR